MKIVVDLQGAQSDSRYRGIGRYCLALVQALVRNAGEHDIWLVMNGALGDLETLQRAFDGLLPRSRMAVFDAPLPVAEKAPQEGARCRAAELLREYFIAQMRPDAVLVTSLFEGWVDDAVTSVGRFVPGTRTAVVLYDLIPLLSPAVYLPTPAQQQYYARKIDSLRRAGLLLAISEHARREALDTLVLDEARVMAVSTAVDGRFCPGSGADSAQLRQLGIVRPFVMYAPGGMDARKNLPGLIAAFAQLAPAVRARHQLVIVSKIDAVQRAELQRCAARHGLAADALVLSGYVDDDLLIGLYRACTLFVFPSLHEGFGLPALEAMACGAAVIGANNSSIPEVIGLDEALFDATDPAAIAGAMGRALADPALLARLRENGRRQAPRFSWDHTAQRCLRALERVFGAAPPPPVPALPPPSAKRRLAFVSPLPPERSGIADYAAQLLPALLDWFDIELVLQHGAPPPPAALAHLPRRDAAWLMAHGGDYDQILYQFGNSPFHGHMFDLLEAHPGVVVLHDFYLGRVLAYEQVSGAMPGAWNAALFHSHGYPGMLAGDPRHDPELAHEIYPCNLAVLQNASAVIVHSAHSKALGADWYGAAATTDWQVVALPRAAPRAGQRRQARAALGIADGVFLVCSFGFIAPSKLTDLLLDAWRDSAALADAQCLLVLVGANHSGAYGEQIAATVAAINAAGGAVRIAGWTDDATYHQFLRAADAAVQLRSASRGETSAAVLDCLNYGVATIVNASGSMAELPADAVCMLDEQVSVASLRDALERLHADPAWRARLGERAAAVLADRHRPAQCAAQYARVLEQAWLAAPTARPALTAALASGADNAALQQFAAALARQPDPLAPRQLLFDVTTIAHHDLRTGIERVVRAQLLALLRRPAGSLRVMPVRLCLHQGRWLYRYAHAYTQALLGLDADGGADHVVDVQPGDILFGADYAPAAVRGAAAQGLYAGWRARGIRVQFQVFDLLPVLQPQFFPEGAAAVHAGWLTAIGGAADQLICISAAVAADLRHWLAAQALPALTLAALHLGADFDGEPVPRPLAAAPASSSPGFLMVGTIEPRKGHLQALAAFELLWERGVDVTLTVVGGEGWKELADGERRTIPRIVARLTSLQQRHGARLRWLQGIDDSALEQLYRDSACLLAPSEGEGFGLPLIEAARHHLPVLARDLPVFREVGGAGIAYFDGTDGAALAAAIDTWLAARARGAIDARPLPWLSWDSHATQLLALLLDDAATLHDSVTFSTVERCHVLQ